IVTFILRYLWQTILRGKLMFSFLRITLISTDIILTSLKIQRNFTCWKLFAIPAFTNSTYSVVTAITALQNLNNLSHKNSAENLGKAKYLAKIICGLKLQQAELIIKMVPVQAR
ncbi:MAG: hypothetical protein V4495_25175, partial [Pseudomonadota bacterium]